MGNRNRGSTEPDQLGNGHGDRVRPDTAVVLRQFEEKHMKLLLQIKKMIDRRKRRQP
jgi:hypothetical protein